MAEKPRFRQGTVFAKNLGFGVGFGYRNNTKTGTSRDTLARIAVSQCLLSSLLNGLG